MGSVFSDCKCVNETPEKMVLDNDRVAKYCERNGKYYIILSNEEFTEV